MKTIGLRLTETGPETMDVTPILSKRLSLVWLCPEFMRAVLDGRQPDGETRPDAILPVGWPDQEMKALIETRLQQMESDPSTAPWLLRLMVRRADHTSVGRINFHGKPDGAGRAELGYSVDEPFRREGYAAEAAGACMSWARALAVRRFLLSISPANLPSLNLAVRLGFNRIGTQIDEVDGEEWVFELVVPRS